MQRPEKGPALVAGVRQVEEREWASWATCHRPEIFSSNETTIHLADL